MNIPPVKSATLARLHPVLSRKLDQFIMSLAVVKKELSGVENRLALVKGGIDNFHLNNFVASKLNRLVGTDPAFRRELSVTPGDLSSLNALLRKHGFEISVKPGSAFYADSKDATLVEVDCNITKLERFRLQPDNVDDARRLASEGFAADVEKILLYETENPVPEIEVLDAGFRYFRQASAWQNYVKVGSLIIALYRQGELSKDGQKGNEYDEYIGDTCEKVALAYLENLNNINQAAEIARQAVKEIPAPSNFRSLELLHSLEMERDYFFDHLRFLRSLEPTIAPEHHDSFIFMKLSAWLATTAGRVPPTAECRELLDLWQAQENRQIVAEITAAGSPDHSLMLLVAWVNLNVGRLNAAGELIKDYIAGLPTEDRNDKTELFISAAICAIYNDRTGAKAQALSFAENANKIMPQGKKVKPLKAVITAVKTILERPAPSAPRAVSKPLPSPPPARPEAPLFLSEETLCRGLFFRDQWVWYYRSFSQDKQLRYLIMGELNDAAFIYRDFLRELAPANLAELLVAEWPLPLTGPAATVAEQLGLAKIILVWENGIKVRLYPDQKLVKSDRYFPGEIKPDFSVELAREKDFRLAGNYLEAVILEQLHALLDPTLAGDLVEKTLTAKLPKPAEPVSPPELPVVIPEPVEVAPVSVPAPPEPTAAERDFFMQNEQALYQLLAQASQVSLDTISRNTAVLQQILSLLDLITERRDQAEDPEAFNLLPTDTDPLKELVKLIRLHGPVRGRKKLTELGLTAETQGQYGLNDQTPSALLSVVSFDLSDENQLIGVIGRSGEFLIPGAAGKDEFIDQLHLTAVEALARATVPDLNELYRLAGLPHEPRRREIREVGTGEINSPRYRLLPAIVILDKDGPITADEISKATEALIKKQRQEAIERGELINQRLFTRHKGIYTSFPEALAEREKLLLRLKPAEIYIQLSRGYTYRLPLGLKKNGQGGTELLPFEIDERKRNAAQQNPVATDLTVRPYLYSVVRYPRDQYLFHPKVSVLPEQPLPPVGLDPVYRHELFGDHEVRIVGTVNTALADRLLVSPQAYAAAAAWAEGKIPELNYADPVRKKKLLGLAPEEKYFLIMPTNRGYYQGRFVSLEEINAPRSKPH